MGNLHEIHIPPDADEPTDWAVRREFGLRWDAYHGGLVREVGLAEMRAPASVARFFCHNPEAQWIADQQQQHSVHWERCVP